MTTATASPALRRDRVLADRLGGTLAREAVLVVAGTLVLTLMARLSVPLPFTPVPVSLGTLGALSVGALGGARRSLLSVVLYTALGVAGAPVFAEDHVGWAFASFGYVLGYVLVAMIAGAAAERGWDRKPHTMLAASLVSLFSVYATGLAWMIPFTHMGLADGVAKGLVPFIVGDLLKAVVAAGVFPVVRSLTRR